MCFLFQSSFAAIVILVLSFVLGISFWFLSRTDVPRIVGLPEIPNALPVIGHLYLLAEDHSSTYQALASRYGHSTFQICLGHKRAVVFNSFEDARRILQKNSMATIDRPKLYTFHGLVSSTQGFSIGSSPWDESCRRKRKFASALLNRSALNDHLDLIDRESAAFIRNASMQSEDASGGTSIKIHAQRYALAVSLTICYGFHPTTRDHALMDEILEVGSGISLLRSASANRQDYIPLLRYLPSDSNRRSSEYRVRRDRYIAALMSRAGEELQKGAARPCITSPLLTNGVSDLSKNEIASTCLSIISGSFESVPATLMMCCATLVTAAGELMQQRAYEDIHRYYPVAGDAWNACLREETVPYVSALVKETLRQFTVTPMIPPRQTAIPLEWDGAIIPAGTMILVNARAANHDARRFGPSANTFEPERWLQASNGGWTEKPGLSIDHFAYGAGSRQCVGAVLANRMLYVALVRLLSRFRLEGVPDAGPVVDPVEFNCAKAAMVAHPRDFRVRFIPREMGDLGPEDDGRQCRHGFGYEV